MELSKLLKQCRYADTSNFDATTNTYHIPKYSKPIYDVGNCYLIKLSSAIVKNADCPLATNWNQGRAPQVDCMKIYVSKALGPNIYVDGVGFDLDDGKDINYMWSGWLDVRELTQLSKIA